MKVVFIGSGNLATRLSLEMQRVGMSVVQVYSRTMENAELLAEKLGCSWSTSLDSINPDADLYVFSLKDAILPDVITHMKPNKGLWVHTAGSMSMQIFEGYIERYGVIYPLQTFSKEREVNFDVIPFFLEANTENDLDLLKKIASALSENVQCLSSDDRKNLHLAAVFACNFANHMYTLAENLLEEKGIAFDVLLPLIDETAAKIHEISPRKAQTGPAVRYDENVINRHLGMLSDSGMYAVYQLVSQNIHKEAQRYE